MVYFYLRQYDINRIWILLFLPNPLLLYKPYAFLFNLDAPGLLPEDFKFY